MAAQNVQFAAGAGLGRQVAGLGVLGDEPQPLLLPVGAYEDRGPQRA